MYLEIVSPEAILFSSEIESVIVPGVNGDFQLLNNHAPIVSILKEGTIKIHSKDTVNKEDLSDKFKSQGNTLTLPIQSGAIEIKDNKVIVLAD